jgi:hypothetical protein
MEDPSMSVRHRERNSQALYIGSLREPGNPPFAYGSKTEGVKEWIDDIEGNRTGANPLEIVKIFEFYPTLAGRLEAWWAPGNYLLEFVDYPVNYQPSAPDPRAEFPGYTISELHDFAWEILAKTNPSTPHVSVPSFVGELKDLPDLIRGAGGDLLRRTMRNVSSKVGWANRTRALINTLGKPLDNPTIPGYLKHIASGHLSWRWAIKPLIGDLRKMCQFAKAANSRLNELRRLRDGKTLKKRCTLGRYHRESAKESKFLHSFYYDLDGWSQKIYTAEVWGSAEWKIEPSSDIPEMDDEELKLFARRLAAGITSHEALAAAWELAPWSWLADWFGNVGTMIAATNNSIGATWGRICVMRRSKGTYLVTVDYPNSASWCTLSGTWRVAMERKDRHPVFPVLPFPLPHLPIFDSGKWSILASLAILRT